MSIMGQRADHESVSRFREDRQLLSCSDAEIARRMGIERSNFSNYFSGRFPISWAFLRKFYKEFREEVDEIRRKISGSSEANGLLERLEAVEERLRKMEKEREEDREKLSRLEQELSRLKEQEGNGLPPPGKGCR